MKRRILLAVAGLIAMNVAAAIRANDTPNDREAQVFEAARSAGAAKEMRVERRQVTGTVAEIDPQQQTLTVAPRDEQQTQTQAAVQKHEPAKQSSLVIQISERAEFKRVTRVTSLSGSPGKTSAQGTGKSGAESMTFSDVQLCVGQMVSVVYEQPLATETAIGAKNSDRNTAQPRTPLLAIRIQVFREPAPLDGDK